MLPAPAGRPLADPFRPNVPIVPNVPEFGKRRSTQLAAILRAQFAVRRTQASEVRSHTISSG